jgi:hypothetical protein
MKNALQFLAALLLWVVFAFLASVGMAILAALFH